MGCGGDWRMGLASFLGLGRGKLRLELSKTGFVTGETVQGTLLLKLKKQVVAGYVEVELYAEERRSTVRGGKQTTEVHRVFENHVRVAEGQTYGPGEQRIPFSFQIPQDVQPKIENELVQTAVSVAQLVGLVARWKWYVKARVDIPKAVDMRSRSIQVFVSQG